MLQEPGKEDLQGKKTQIQLWEKGLCLQVLCLPLGLVCLVAQVLFHEYFYFIAGLKLGVVELVLQHTDLRGAGCTVDAQTLAWDVLLPVRGWNGSSKNTKQNTPLLPG